MGLGTFNIVTAKDLTIDGNLYKAGERVGVLTPVIDIERVVNGLNNGALKVVPPPTFSDVAESAQAVVEAKPVETKAAEASPAEAPAADIPAEPTVKKAKGK
jgi:hypothetical protein